MIDLRKRNAAIEREDAFERKAGQVQRDCRRWSTDMTLRRVLMWLQADAANSELIATGARIAAEHGAELIAVITTPKLSRSGHWAVGGMVSGMASEVETRAERAAVELAGAVAQARTPAALTGATITKALSPHLYGEFVAVKGRTSDLVIARATADEDARGQIEALVFAAARPVLLLPDEEDSTDHEFDPHKIALAWDGSRTATRATFDALPLLKRAHQVTLIQVTDDKDLSRSGTVAELSTLLAGHGVKSTTLEVRGRGRPTAEALKDAFEQCGAGLLVMGAYGHSRAREFILGGATLGTLQACAFPVLLSH
jgi:nucleotide-binding universal stress UspA family protein